MTGSNSLSKSTPIPKRNYHLQTVCTRPDITLALPQDLEAQTQNRNYQIRKSNSVTRNSMPSPAKPQRPPSIKKESSPLIFIPPFPTSFHLPLSFLSLSPLFHSFRGISSRDQLSQSRTTDITVPYQANGADFHRERKGREK